MQETNAPIKYSFLRAAHLARSHVCMFFLGQHFLSSRKEDALFVKTLSDICPDEAQGQRFPFYFFSNKQGTYYRLMIPLCCY